MNKYVCRMCGYVELKDAPPEKCPSCGAPKSQFQEKEGALKTASDPSNLTELEKKHIAVIDSPPTCDLIPGCRDINIKIGEIVHPMDPDKHWIMFADVYLDNEFISRVKLEPAQLNPAFGLHLKSGSGKVAVVSHCNLHGNYLSEKEI